MRLDSRYVLTRPFGNWVHSYEVIGELGGIQIHINDSGKEGDFHGRYHGGIEEHHRFCPAYHKGNAPSQSPCWLLKVPCWHDGSSLYAEETLIPKAIACDFDAKQMLLVAEREYMNRFHREEDGE